MTSGGRKKLTPDDVRRAQNYIRDGWHWSFYLKTNVTDVEWKIEIRWTLVIITTFDTSHFERSLSKDVALWNLLVIPKRVSHALHIWHVPLWEVTVERCYTGEHSVHGGYFWHVPSWNMAVKRACIIDYFVHVVGDTWYITLRPSWPLCQSPCGDNFTHVTKARLRSRKTVRTHNLSYWPSRTSKHRIFDWY